MGSAWLQTRVEAAQTHQKLYDRYWQSTRHQVSYPHIACSPFQVTQDASKKVKVIKSVTPYVYACLMQTTLARLLFIHTKWHSLDDRAYAHLGVSSHQGPSISPQTLKHAIVEFHKQCSTTASKLKHAIYQFELLDKKLERAERNIQQLSELSCLLYSENRCDGKVRSLDDVDLYRLIEFQWIIDGYAAFLSYLHSITNMVPDHIDYHLREPILHDQWGIELGLPESLDYALDHERADIDHVDFTVRTEAVDMRTSARRWRIQRPAILDPLFQEYRAIHDIVQHTRREVRTEEVSQPMLKRLPDPQSRSMNFKRYLSTVAATASQRIVSCPEIRGPRATFRSQPSRAATTSDKILRDMLAQTLVSGSRADVAFGLSYCLLLTWSSPWLQDVCSCGLRSIVDSLDDVHHVFWSEPHLQHVCYEGPQAYGPLFRLGVVLVELALVRPLVVSSRYALRFQQVSC